MERIEQEQANQDAEAVLHSAEDVSDDALLRAAGNEAGPPTTPSTGCYPAPTSPGWCPGR